MIVNCMTQLAAPVLLAFSTMPIAHLTILDMIVIAVYFGMVIWIGFYLKGKSNTSEEFFMAGREMTAWIAGLSFVSANLGSLELMGWAGSAYQYGILATHWYWIGAIPAMVFLGLVMMPFYYVSKTHSVPGYLNLRFGEPARILAAISFATEMILMSGVNMFAMAVVMKVVLGWDISFSILISAAAVAIYVTLGGLRSAIFNEVMQFVLIWGGALLVPILGLTQAGGWSGLKTQIIKNMGTDSYFHMWRDTGHFASNPMGVHWTGIVLGLGFVISFGYWTTDFLVVQRVLAAHNLRAARMAPIIGSYFKMAVPFIVILPGLLGLVLLQNPDGSRRLLVGEDVVKSCVVNDAGSVADAARCTTAMNTKSTLPAEYQQKVLTGAQGTELHSYNEALPLMMVRYMGPGLLGLGITALIAGFMSGMAGNVSAFSTVWTYDIYKPLINREGSDSHYVMVGRMLDSGRRDRLHRRGIPGAARARHYGLCAGALQLLHRASAGRHLDGNVLEARHCSGRLPRTADRHQFFGRYVCVGQVQSRRVGDDCAFARCQADGRESVSRLVGLLHQRPSSSSWSVWSPSPSRSPIWMDCATVARFCPKKSRFRFTRTSGFGRFWRSASLQRSTFSSGSELFALSFLGERKDHELCMVLEFKSGFSSACFC